MEESVLKSVLSRRRDRAIAIILSAKERLCDEHLPSEASHKLRKVVLDQLNEYHDFTMDIVDSLDGGGVILNDLYVERLDEIHGMVTKLLDEWDEDG